MYPNLKLRLWTTGLRQHELAELIGIDETLLSKIINGHRKPARALRSAIASALNQNEEWLFEEAAPSHQPERQAQSADAAGPTPAEA